MTKDEAINTLNASDYLWCRPNEEEQIALNMAIEALSAPSGDLISRADAIEAVRLESAKRGSLGRGDILNVLSALPSAEQVTSKLNNHCNSLLTDESNGSKEHKSKLDLISRAEAIEELKGAFYFNTEDCRTAINCINALPSADAIHSGGVFVPNMEMPKVCDYCLFHDSEWSWCKAKDKYCGDGKCPLIAVRGERREP